ncbi:hypothetical protein EYF80_012250 [Liparis tanakae]|uniref:Uncharacterized protein n=1 Tax=Liparis tanakae TaxID=230148 RepID=A0A4Z2IHN5_9TELE|nr:hypothetical protein EYF80_012250 [Liparis tanakae]
MKPDTPQLPDDPTVQHTVAAGSCLQVCRLIWEETLLWDYWVSSLLLIFLTSYEVQLRREPRCAPERTRLVLVARSILETRTKEGKKESGETDGKGKGSTERSRGREEGKCSRQHLEADS